MTFSPDRLREALTAHVPPAAAGLVVALSGGADSSCLLAAAAGLGSAFRGLPLRAVHVDHGLQPAAAGFRAACEALAARYSISLSIIGAAVDSGAGVSVEAAARDARYAALGAQLAAGECLLTAHHALDQAETLLLQALRGAGLKGLSSMPACRPFAAGWHVRPLLEVSRADLERYAAALGIDAVRDPMNADVQFDRAYLRHVVWPLLEARWPGAARALSRSAAHAAEAQELLDAGARADLDALRDGEALSVPRLRSLAPARRINALRRWLFENAVRPPSTLRLREALRQMLAAEADHLPAVIWRAHALRRYRDRIFLTAAAPPRLESARDWPHRAVPVLDLGAGLGQLRCTRQSGGLAPGRLPDVLTVARRVGGETLKAGAQASTQSVQHLCQAHGVLPWLRDALPLIFAEGSLIAIGDLWLDARWCAAAGEAGCGFAWTNGPTLV
jgi:tRNA(Ile)-lysidine synthase